MRQAALPWSASRSTTPSSAYWKSGTRMVNGSFTSMRLPELGRAALADQEVEIDALVGLQHGVDVELRVAALVRRLESLPGFAAARQLGLGHVEMQLSLLDVELDHVAVLNQRQRSARRRLRRHMQHDRAIGGAAHARIGHA